MPQKKAMKDLIVVLPGILGSVLQKDGEIVWGLSFGSVIRNLFSLGRALGVLKLPDGIGHDDPRDGVVAARLLPDMHLIPGLWKIDGYSSFIAFLESRFELRRTSDALPGNLIEFPYDWRLSNRLNGRRLADTALPALERWRTSSGNPAAQLVLIGHSMGGLVARAFLEEQGGAEATSKLITLGTPYRGSVNALNALSNGVSVPLPPLRDTIDQIVRSLPSAHQLLPTYACVGEGDALATLDSLAIPNIAPTEIADAFAFHRAINDSAAQGTTYEVFPLKGVIQPTSQSAVLRAGRIEPLQIRRGEDRKGDGTVPRISSHPPEWENDARAVFFAQQHASLQTDTDLHRQIEGILSSSAEEFFAMDATLDVAGDRLGVSLPDVVETEQALTITARSEFGDDGLKLQAELRHEDGTRLPPVPLRAVGGGVHEAAITDLPPGSYAVTVASTLAASPIDPVTGLSLVWSEMAE